MTTQMPKIPLRYFLDTEFIERPFYLDPISIAIVCDDGRELYLVNAEHDPSKADDWVRENVLAKLPPRSDPAWKTKAEIAAAMRAFFAEAEDTVPEIWGWFADYDWVLFSWLMGGRMIDLPEGYPNLCRDVKQLCMDNLVPKSALPPKPAGAHDALVDARWNRQVYHYVTRLLASTVRRELPTAPETGTGSTA